MVRINMISGANQEAVLSSLLEAAVNALQGSSELIERYVWSVAPDKAAEVQKRNYRTLRALESVDVHNLVRPLPRACRR